MAQIKKLSSGNSKIDSKHYQSTKEESNRRQANLQPVVLGYSRPRKLIDDILVGREQRAVFRRRKLVLVL